MYSTSESTAPTSRDARTPASRAQVHIPYHLSEARNNVACGPIDSNTFAAARVPTIPLRHTTASRWQASCRKALAESCCCRCVLLLLLRLGAAASAEPHARSTRSLSGRACWVYVLLSARCVRRVLLGGRACLQECMLARFLACSMARRFHAIAVRDR